MVKNRRYLIDSSVIMALFNEEDRQYKKAIEVFKRIKKEKREIKISCITVVELVSLMKYKKFNSWQKYSEKLIDGSMFILDNAYFFDQNDLSWELVMKKEKIGMVDAIEIEHCLQNDEELLSFDEAQNKVWKELDLKN
jgi:predicted nucleic acid-binding protein